MKNDPIISLYIQQTDILIRHLHMLLDQNHNTELERLLSQFQHSHVQLVDHIEQLTGAISMVSLLTSAFEVELVLKHMLDTIIDVTGAERAFIMLRQAENEVPVIVAARAWDQNEIDEADEQFSKSIVNHVWHTKKTAITVNAQSDSRFGHISSIQSKALRSLICIPVIQHDQVIGVLYADNRVTKGVFRESMIPILEIVSHYAAIALENARRFEETTHDLNTSRRQVRQLQIQSANQQLNVPLSPRELDVLVLIAKNQNNAEIAEALSVGISTVKKHINHIYSKLLVSNRSQAILKAQDIGLV